MSILINLPKFAEDHFGPALRAAFPDRKVLFKHELTDADVPEIDFVLAYRQEHGEFKRYPNLRAVMSIGAGVERIMEDPDLPPDLPIVRFVHPRMNQHIGDYVVLQCLKHQRNDRMFQKAQRERNWLTMSFQPPSATSTVGILGFGVLGQDSGRKLKAVGFNVIGWSKHAKNVDGIKSYAGDAELPDFLAQADIVVCLLPLTPDTRNILCAGFFGKMKKGASLINLGRGGHLKEDDLIPALDSGQLSEATLDVVVEEPMPPEHPFWVHERITITPHHAGGASPQDYAEYLQNIVTTVESGGQLQHLVDHKLGY